MSTSLRRDKRSILGQMPSPQLGWPHGAVRLTAACLSAELLMACPQLLDGDFSKVTDPDAIGGAGREAGGGSAPSLGGSTGATGAQSAAAAGGIVTESGGGGTGGGGTGGGGTGGGGMTDGGTGGSTGGDTAVGGTTGGSPSGGVAGGMAGAAGVEEGGFAGNDLSAGGAAGSSGSTARGATAGSSGSAGSDGSLGGAGGTGGSHTGGVGGGGTGGSPVMDCSNKLVLTTAIRADFDEWDGATAPLNWYFTFDGDAESRTILGSFYDYNEGGTAQFRLGSANGDVYAEGLNPNASQWGGGVGLEIHCVDATRLEGVDFWMHGTSPEGGGEVGLLLASGLSVIHQFELTVAWSHVQVPWGGFVGSEQSPLATTNGNNIVGFFFNALLIWTPNPLNPTQYSPQPGAYDIYIDDVGFY